MAIPKKKILTITIILIPSIALIALVTLLFLMPRSLSDLEQNSFEEKTHDVVNFLELFDPATQVTEEDKKEIKTFGNLNINKLKKI